MLTRRVLLATVAVGLATALAAEAQQAGHIAGIGWLTTTAPPPYILDAFLGELRARGWLNGRNILLERRFSYGRAERFPALAAELVQMKVDLIITSGTPASLAAKKATTAVPIVMAEAVPLLSRVAVLSNPANPAHTVATRGTQAAAASLGLALQFFELTNPGDFETTFTAIRRSRVDALFTIADPLTYAERARILEFAANNRLAAIYEWKDFVDLGGLMAYGPNIADMFRHAAIYADKILKGVKPADLPVEQVTKFELVINLKTAKALGLTIPPSLLVRADHVIQ